jgi:hypothetical protein
MGPGSHVGFPISAKNTNLVYDQVLYQICVFGADLKSNMAARVHNVFSLAEILKIFLLETTKDRRRTLTHDKSSHGLWPGELIKRIMPDKPYRQLNEDLVCHACFGAWWYLDIT